MSYVTPKTNWDTSYLPSPEDLNRIEDNTKQNHIDIEAEITARISDVNAEEIARISADNALDLRISEIEDLFEEEITAGDTLARFFEPLTTTSSTTYISVKSFKSPFNGFIRVKFLQNAVIGGESYARILKNGVQVQEFITSSTTPIERVINLSISLGDIISLEHKATTQRSKVDDFGLYYNDTGNVLFNIWATQ